MPPTDSRPTNEHRDPRIYYAAERTMLAWVRTGIALMGFGFVVERFGLFLREIAVARDVVPTTQPGASLWVGTVLILLGVWVNIAAAIRHVRFRRRFERGDSFIMPTGTDHVVLSLMLALLGLCITAYFVFVSRSE
jgi:putative membrane protein